MRPLMTFNMGSSIIRYSRLLSSMFKVSFVPSKGLAYVNRLTISTNNQQKIAVGQHLINYEKVGGGSHTLLLLPGGLGTIDTDFRPQLDTLDTSKFTMIAWDPPGYGRSRPPDRDFSGGAQMYYRDARTAAQLMTELKEDKYSIIGWSDGGVTALVMAALFPNSVRKIVVTAANAFVNDKLCEAQRSLRDIDTWSRKMRTPMLEIYGEEYLRKTWAEACDAGIEIYEKHGGDICKEELPRIKCPTLIVHGDQDPMVGMEHAEYLKEHIKNSRLFIMEGGKHNLHLRHFKKFNRLVEEFLLEEEKQLDL